MDQILILTIVIQFLGILSSGLVMISVLVSSFKRQILSPAMLLNMNVCISDFIICAVGLFSNIALLSGHLRSLWADRFFCQVVGVSYQTCSAVPMMILILIPLIQWLVVRGVREAPSVKQTWLMILCIWLIAFMFALAPLIFVKYNESMYGPYIPRPADFYCWLSSVSRDDQFIRTQQPSLTQQSFVSPQTLAWTRGMMILDGISFMMIPVTIIFLNGLIFMHLKRLERDSASDSTNARLLIYEAQRSVFLRGLILASTFIVAWFLIVASIFKELITNEPVSRLFDVVGANVAGLAYLLNPIILCILDETVLDCVCSSLGIRRHCVERGKAIQKKTRHPGTTFSIEWTGSV